MQRYERKFVQLVAEASGLTEEEIRPEVRTPEPDKGDICLPCFPFAKTQRKNPAAIAAAIAGAVREDPHFESIAATGPFVNAILHPVHLVKTVVSETVDLNERFATSQMGQGRRVVIDYSSPNIAKPLGFHHLRSTMIGNALSRIHAALGYEVVGINFLGDWGKTFGLLAEAFDRFGNTEALDAGGISYLLQLYVKANEAAAADPDFDEAARAMFRRQEERDPHALALWELFREISLKEFQRVYRRLDVRFDLIEGESRYRDGMAAVIDEIARKPGVREDQGALIVAMPYGAEEPPMMLKKSDGATLYATRDVAAAIDRFERYGFEKSLYVVGGEQKRHFDQLKRALKAMGHEWSDRMVHVYFGRIQGMSTRRGTVVYLDEVLDEARERAREKMAETAAKRDLDLDTVAEAVGVGGIIFGDLKNLRTSDYAFNWEELLNPKGFTGICVQYAHARCCSILRKGGGAPEMAGVDLSLIRTKEEVALVKDLAKIPGAVEAAADALEPSKLARAIYEVARSWNRYQQAGNADAALRILHEDEGLKRARLALVDAVRIAIAKSLGLLGIKAPEAM